MSALAPIVLFTYNRLSALEGTINALKKNYLAQHSDLFVYSDGYKGDFDLHQVLQVREYLKSIRGFKSITIIESSTNKGLANSVIGGVSEVLNKYKKIIVLEDDLVTSSNFLTYMNEALFFYKDIKEVFSISGYIFNMRNVKSSFEYDIFYIKRHCSWGWGIWEDRWSDIDWEVSDFMTFKSDRGLQRRFNSVGSDMTRMLFQQMKGKINSWAIRACYHQFKKGTYTVYPKISKVSNIGFDKSATHSYILFNRFRAKLDTTEKNKFLFPKSIIEEKVYERKFVSNFSFFVSVIYYLINRVLKLFY